VLPSSYQLLTEEDIVLANSDDILEELLEGLK